MILVIVAVVMISLLQSAAASVFDISSYGAVGDGHTINTAAITAAMRDAHAAFLSSGQAGQLVTAHDGVYLSGQITLLSGVTLSVAPSARLLASSNVSDYPLSQDAWAFIWSDGAQFIGLTGGGTLDGNWQQYIGGWEAPTDRFVPVGWPACTGECRPRLVKFHRSTDIEVDNITMTGSPDWTFHIWGCARVLVQYVTQWGDERWPNNDGIDIDSSVDVVMRHSSFDTADDGVCIKTTLGYGPLSNLSVYNVSIRSRSGAVKFGSATPEDMYNCVFDNLYIHDSNRGLGIQQRDGGNIYNVLFSNIFINGTRFWPVGWWGSGEPIYISNMPRAAGQAGGRTWNITFVNVSAVSQNGIVVSGRAPGSPLENITLRAVSVRVDKLNAWNYSSSSVPSSPPTVDYEPTTAVQPVRVNMTGWMPALYVEGVSSMAVEGLYVEFVNADYQAYWGTGCFNASGAGSFVDLSNTTCVPPAAPDIV